MTIATVAGEWRVERGEWHKDDDVSLIIIILLLYNSKVTWSRSVGILR